MQRLIKIFRETFKDDSIVLRPEISPKEIVGWDSLNHINLVLIIEEEFRVAFTTEEIINAKSVGLLVELLNNKGCNLTWGAE